MCIRDSLRTRLLHGVFNDLGGYATTPEVVLYFTAPEFARKRVGAGLGETRLRQPAARDERVQQLFDLFGNFGVEGEFARHLRTSMFPPRKYGQCPLAQRDFPFHHCPLSIVTGRVTGGFTPRRKSPWGTRGPGGKRRGPPLP